MFVFVFLEDLLQLLKTEIILQHEVHELRLCEIVPCFEKLALQTNIRIKMTDFLLLLGDEDVLFIFDQN